MIADMPIPMNPTTSGSACPAGEGSIRTFNTIGIHTTHTAVRGT